MQPSIASRPSAPQRFLIPEQAPGVEQTSGCAAAVCFRFLGTRTLEQHACSRNRMARASRRLAIGGFPLGAMSVPPKPLFIRIHHNPAE